MKHLMLTVAGTFVCSTIGAIVAHAEENQAPAWTARPRAAPTVGETMRVERLD